jgi:hypothetical protein
MPRVRAEVLSHHVTASLQGVGLRQEESGLWLGADLDVGALEHCGHVVVGALSLRWPRREPPPEYVLVDAVHLAPPVDDDALTAAVREARARGLARRRQCRRCGRAVNPGLMQSLDMCMSCVEWRLHGGRG